MDRPKLLKQVNEIFCQAFADDSLVVTEETSAKDIEDWDSLMQITLITAVEKKFGVEFSMDDVIGMQNVGDMLSIILKRAVL